MPAASASKKSGDLKDYAFDYYEFSANQNIELFEKTQALSNYMNELDSDEPPFNIFQGNILLANHAMPTGTMIAIRLQIGYMWEWFFDEDGTRLEHPKIDVKRYQELLTRMRFTLNCLRIFRKLASGECKPEKFRIREVLDKVIKDRPSFSHDKNVEFKVQEIENAEIYFDKEALYWIAMRMLSNAEHATAYNENTWIRMQTYRQNDGKLYLIVRNNGNSMEEMAKASRARGGGKSRPNIDKLCKDLDSAFILKGFPDHTRACLRLPLAVGGS